MDDWDDFWETMFIMFASWRVLLVVAVVLIVLSLTGVIPWGEWL
jgi:hypothetical protein